MVAEGGGIGGEGGGLGDEAGDLVGVGREVAAGDTHVVGGQGARRQDRVQRETFVVAVGEHGPVNGGVDVGVVRGVGFPSGGRQAEGHGGGAELAPEVAHDLGGRVLAF